MDRNQPAIPLLESSVRTRKPKLPILYKKKFSWTEIQQNSKNGNNYFPNYDRPCTKFLKLDHILILVFLIISIATHFYKIDHPNQTCFDETFFGNFTNHYIKQEYFFDIHPPLGKLILYSGARLLGYDASIDFGMPGKVFENNLYIRARCANAVWSCLCSPLLYAASRLHGFSLEASSTVAFLTAFETSMIVEGKFILTDGILHCSACFSILMFGLLRNIKPNTRNWIYCFLANCIAVTITASIKQTALSFVPIFLILVFELLYRAESNHSNGILSIKFISSYVKATICFLVIFFSLRLLIFAKHISLLRKPTKDCIDVFPDMFQLHINQTEYWERYLNSSLIKRSLHLMKKMSGVSLHGYKDNDGLQSMWYQWPLQNWKPISFSTSPEYWVRCIVNVPISVAGLVSLAIIIISFYFEFYQSKTIDSKHAGIVSMEIVFGYISSYLPFYFIPRATYMYHYILPLIFSIFAIGAYVDLVRKIDYMWGKIAAISLCAAGLGFFIFIAPWVYGLPLPSNRNLCLRHVWCK